MDVEPDLPVVLEQLPPLIAGLAKDFDESHRRQEYSTNHCETGWKLLVGHYKKGRAMPKIVCNCGNIIDESNIPASGEHLFIKGEDWDIVIEKLAEAARSTDGSLLRERLSDALASMGRHFYRCSSCRGLLVEREADGTFEFFQAPPEPR